MEKLILAPSVDSKHFCVSDDLSDNPDPEIHSWLTIATVEGDNLRVYEPKHPHIRALLPNYSVTFENESPDDFREFETLRGFEHIAELYDFINRNCHAFFAGGWVAHMAGANNNPSDIDIYARDWESANAIASYLETKMGMKIVVDNEYLITLDNPENSKMLLPVQIIKGNVFENPEDIISAFDFSVCRAVLLSPTTILGDCELLNRNAKIRRMKGAVRTMRRVFKYMNKGYQFSDEQLEKIVNHADTDENDVEYDTDEKPPF